KQTSEAIGVAEFPMGFGVIGIGAQGLAEQRNGFFDAAGVGKHVGHVDAGVDLIGLQRKSVLKCGLSFAIFLDAAETKGSVGIVSAAKLRPSESIVGSEVGGLLEHFDGKVEIAFRIESDAAQIVFVGERVDGLVGLEALCFRGRKSEFEAVDDIGGDVVLDGQKLVVL